MNYAEFAISPQLYGLPSREELIQLRIWDLHFHGFFPREEGGEVDFYVDRMGIEHVISLDAGPPSLHPVGPRSSRRWSDEIEARQWELFEQKKDRFSGILRIDLSYLDETLALMEKWIRNGPAIGIKYGLSNHKGLGADHPVNDPIIRLARDLNAVVYIHTWTKVGGSPRHPGGGNSGGEATPMQLVKLAQRFPDVPLICGHSGGDWELGARVVRPYENVYFEFSGSDPHSGSVDYAVKELGADRIVWGGHGPSRSYATELGKVLDSDLSRSDRMKVLGGNIRRLAAPIMRSRGRQVEI